MRVSTARKYGGDLIILLSSDNETVYGSTGKILYSSEKATYIFIIGKLKK